MSVFLHLFHSSKECILRYRGSCNFAFIVLYFYISLFFASDIWRTKKKNKFPFLNLDPNGTIFGSPDNQQGGLILYTFDDLQVSSTDEIVFGFMTFYEDGLLYRAESRLGNEYIAIKLVRYQPKTPTPPPRPHTIWI